MDEIEFLLIQPQILGIVNDELKIWRNPGFKCQPVGSFWRLMERCRKRRTVLVGQDLNRCLSPDNRENHLQSPPPKCLCLCQRPDISGDFREAKRIACWRTLFAKDGVASQGGRLLARLRQIHCSFKGRKLAYFIVGKYVLAILVR